MIQSNKWCNLNKEGTLLFLVFLEGGLQGIPIVIYSIISISRTVSSTRSFTVDENNITIPVNSRFPSLRSDSSDLTDICKSLQDFRKNRP